jgi:hypothetical protein
MLKNQSVMIKIVPLNLYIFKVMKLTEMCSIPDPFPSFPFPPAEDAVPLAPPAVDVLLVFPPAESAE